MYSEENSTSTDDLFTLVWFGCVCFFFVCRNAIRKKREKQQQQQRHQFTYTHTQRFTPKIIRRFSFFCTIQRQRDFNWHTNTQFNTSCSWKMTLIRRILCHTKCYTSKYIQSNNGVIVCFSHSFIVVVFIWFYSWFYRWFY